MTEKGAHPTRRHHRRALLASAAIAASVACASPSAVADQPEAPQPSPTVTPLAYPNASCAPAGELAEVEEIIWDEISRLVAEGLPACDVTWLLEPPYDGSWGIAYTAEEAKADRPLIVLDPNLDTYTDDLEPEERTPTQLDTDVRTAVRHEFAHTLTYMLGYDDETLREMFPAELEGANLSESTRLGLEASADAITQALTPEGAERTWMYDRDVDEISLVLAHSLIQEARDMVRSNDETAPARP